MVGNIDGTDICRTKGHEQIQSNHTSLVAQGCHDNGLKTKIYDSIKRNCHEQNENTEEIFVPTSTSTTFIWMKNF